MTIEQALAILLAAVVSTAVLIVRLLPKMVENRIAQGRALVKKADAEADKDKTEAAANNVMVQYTIAYQTMSQQVISLTTTLGEERLRWQSNQSKNEVLIEGLQRDLDAAKTSLFNTQSALKSSMANELTYQQRVADNQVEIAQLQQQLVEASKEIEELKRQMRGVDTELNQQRGGNGTKPLDPAVLDNYNASHPQTTIS